MTYSLDFRQKVFEVKEKQGLTFEETSQLFGISMKTLFRWQQRLEPCMKRNKPATKIDMELLSQDVVDFPDAYQWERAERFGVSAWGIGVALRRLRISHKKNA